MLTKSWFSVTPTAQASFPESATTPVSELVGSVPFGLDTTVHAVPSQCSVSVLPPAVPTAQTSVVANAETDDSSPRPPGPFGLDTTVQAVPSQCSARVLPPATPTAHTSFDEMTERASSCANAWLVLGERPIDHAVPLQCSTSGRPDWRLVLLPSPTAQTSLEEAPATPRRMLALAPMFTDRTIFHVAPSQCSVIDFSEP